ncbi:MAG TPA: hypothetical protein VF644_21665 [Pyrinomonadaceae bacterium]|jgi:hypothetical protein
MKQILHTVIILLVSFSVSAQTRGARKVDEFVLSNCEVAMARLDNYALSLQNEPTTIAHIIFYEGKILESLSKKILPRRGEAEARVNDLKRYLVENRLIPSNRIEIINGGIRKEHSVEFWTVPNDASAPKPTPTLKKIKYAKGNPSRLCSEMF